MNKGWFSYGDVNWFSVLDPVAYWIVWTDYSGNTDIAFWQQSGSGTSFNQNSLRYPWTSTGVLADPIWAQEMPTLTITSVRNGLPNDYNIFQFFGVSNIALWRAWLYSFNTVRGNYSQWFTAFSATGWTAVGTFSNSTGDSINTLLVWVLWRFNWFRIGKAELVEKKACSINFNVCEWSYEWANLECVAWTSANGLPLWECGLAWSGSIYGSGACVPMTNASGAIIPPSPLVWYATTNASGAIIGTVYPPETASTVFGGVFNCGIDPDADNWWRTIWKALICPITVIWNTWKFLYDKVANTSSKVNQIEQITTSTLSWVTEDTQTNGYTWSNTLLQKMNDIQNGVADNEKVKFWWWMFIFAVAMACLWMTIGILKK